MIDFVQRFDRRRMFQYVNDEPSVLHCHHYATLFAKVAIDQAASDGPRLLAEAMEDAAYLVLTRYFIAHDVAGTVERKSAAEEYSALMGLGLLRIDGGARGGSAAMQHAHVDEGWIKKWGTYDRPVNFMGQGYIAAAFAAIHDRPIRSYAVEERSSIVKGDPKSTFAITLRETTR